MHKTPNLGRKSGIKTEFLQNGELGYFHRAA